ncbi:hypothetical protein CAPTEDRAFT_210682 [Capitella teleta]|uniref:Uncharacterized protein n=1 Tax=Capitella teleta TaxID=283909 RepID=R7U9P0_CAPTE|nr:hypothetical protein CAPTEDRAFT_210682 [Capitella teleta]|eukprot:ELU02851.1 hypothetical protein CAPTEDRAFT_210682 [Capitella teleta]
MDKYSNLSDSEKRRLSDDATRSWRRDVNGQLPMKLLINFDDETDHKDQRPTNEQPAQPRAVSSHKLPPSMLDPRYTCYPFISEPTSPPPPPPGFVNSVVTVASEYHGTTYYHRYNAPACHPH